MSSGESRARAWAFGLGLVVATGACDRNSGRPVGGVGDGHDGSSLGDGEVPNATGRAPDGSALSGPIAATEVVDSPHHAPTFGVTWDSGAKPGPERGQEVYERYCDFCHGARGQGYAADEAPALANDDLLAIASDEYLEKAILRGRPGTTMSSWSTMMGGPLTDEDARSVVAYLRNWQKRPSETPKAPEAGDPAKGAKLYAAECARCHGVSGRDGKYIALANPELLLTATNGFLARSIELGRTGTPMPAFGSKLAAGDIADLVALLRSWQRPFDASLDLPPKPGKLKSVLLNPKGPAPLFDAKADFVPVDVVKKELDRGATMIIVDARAPSDYARQHVAGAISVPFYDVAAYAPQIPKGRWVLTYCACPHAASVKARDALRGLGYKQVAVLDEGILTWRDRGYPVRGGSKP